MIGNNLRVFLAKRDMSQSELSRKTGISRQMISDIYHEINITVSMENLEKLCSFFDCEVGELFFRYDEKKKKPYNK